MSIQYGKLCSVILLQHFGETVQKVGECLFTAIQSRTLSMIIKSTGLTKAEVTHALAVLLKFKLALFQPSKNELFVEYSIDKEAVLLILRYPRFVHAFFLSHKFSNSNKYKYMVVGRYVHLVQTKIKNGQAAASIVEELLRSGSQTASRLLARCCDDKANYQLFEDTFVDLCKSHYLIRDSMLTESSSATGMAPKFTVDVHDLYTPPTKLTAVEWDKLRRDETTVTGDNGTFFPLKV